MLIKMHTALFCSL